MIRPKVALVLGGGGARGLAHIGVLKALVAHGVPINMVAGTSFGALVGGLYASGMNVGNLEAVTKAINKSLIAKMLAPGFSKSGLIQGKRIKQYLKTLLGDSSIEQFQIPFAAVATDLYLGEEIVLNSGSVVEAIMASIAVPIIFKPVLYQNRYMVDGGLVNPLPVSVASALGADVIIGVNVHPQASKLGYQELQFKAMYDRQHKNRISRTRSQSHRWVPPEASKFGRTEKPTTIIPTPNLDSPPSLPPSMRTVLIQTITIMEDNIMMARLSEKRPDILISPDCSSYDFLGFHRAEELIEVGKVAAIKALPEIAKLV
jgi:NTE family protein